MGEKLSPIDHVVNVFQIDLKYMSCIVFAFLAGTSNTHKGIHIEVDMNSRVKEVPPEFQKSEYP